MNIKDRIILFIEYKKISIKQFEEKCNLSNGYVSSMRKGFGAEKLNNVLCEFSELNRDWLLYGEGEMLKTKKKITNIGDINSGGNTTIAQHGSTANDPTAIDKLVTEIREQRIMYGSQIDRLLTLLEKK